MCYRILIIILNFAFLFGYGALAMKLLKGIVEASWQNKNWIYEMKSVSAKSSNTDLVNFNLDIERVARGVYALSGEIVINVDVLEHDGSEVEVNIFRKVPGDEDYKSLPYQMSRRHLYDALNTFYKDIAMESLKDCSNMPYFEDKAPVPIEKKTYILDKCKISEDDLPNHMEFGEYKVITTGYGEVDWEVVLYVEIEPNSE